MAITSQVSLWYMVQDIFEDYLGNRATRVRSNTTPFFSEVGLRKFILASELFVPRPYFIRHLTAKWGAKISWLPLQFLFQRRWSKFELKTKNLNHTRLLSNLAKVGVGKRFFDLSTSSLARRLQILVDNWVFLHLLWS